MGYILLGHGGLDVDTSVTPPDMEFVAIPQGTTIQFYADSGQGLAFNSAQLDIWEQLQAPWPALDSSRVTYNLSLYSAKELWGEELKNDPAFGGHTLVRASIDGVPDPIRMCTGSRETCPTDPRQVAEGATHTCDGILGTYTGDLYWLACTSFSNAAPSLENAALSGASANVVLGADPDWHPGDSDLDAIAEINKKNVQSASDAETLPYVVGGFVFLVGDGHEQSYVHYAHIQHDTVEGTVTVRKGDGLDSETLEVVGAPPAKQGVIEDAVSRFSPEAVQFA